MTVSIKNQPFLATLRKMAAQQGLCFTFRRHDGASTGMQIQLMKSDDPQMEMDGPMLDREPFIAIATSVQRQWSVGMQAEKAARPPLSHEEVFVNFVIFADPKLRTANPTGAPVVSAEGWKTTSADKYEPWDLLRS